MVEALTFSIVITNYNLGRFLGQAIDSALNLEWHSIEIIVVDDGSTDNSRPIIQSYDGMIQQIFQPNQGQRVACNVGFAASSGEAVIFLDADDVLLPTLAREVAAVWHEQISKVQVIMQKVDAEGRPMRVKLPYLHELPTTAQIRQWAISTGEYPTPPGSGNIYSRSFLEKIMPLSETRDSAPDSTYIAMAPFFGELVTIPQTLALYRIHGANNSNVLTGKENFGREVARAMKRLEATQDACRVNQSSPPSLAILRRGSHLLQLRAASLRVLPARHPLPGDSTAHVLIDAVRLPFRKSFEPVHRRLAMALYVVLVIATPLPLALRLIRIRFQAR